MAFPRTIYATWHESFSDCHKKFEYEQLAGLSLKRANIHRHFGRCFAEGLRVTRIAYYGKDKRSALTAIRMGACALIQAWSDFPVEVPDPPRPTPHVKSLASCLDAHFSFFEEYPLADDPVKPLMIDGEPAVEQKFQLPIGVNHPESGEPILYGGRLDMLGHFNNFLAVDDEKTTTRLGEDWGKQWNLRSSVTGYYWGMRSLGFNVQSALIRGVGIMKRDITFKPILQSRTQYQVDLWYEQLNRSVENMIKCYKEGYFDYALNHACSDFGGCDFANLCLTEHPERYLDDYEQRVRRNEQGNPAVGS